MRPLCLLLLLCAGCVYRVVVPASVPASAPAVTATSMTRSWEFMPTRLVLDGCRAGGVLMNGRPLPFDGGHLGSLPIEKSEHDGRGGLDLKLSSQVAANGCITATTLTLYTGQEALFTTSTGCPPSYAVCSTQARGRWYQATP